MRLAETKIIMFFSLLGSSNFENPQRVKRVKNFTMTECAVSETFFHIKRGFHSGMLREQLQG